MAVYKRWQPAGRDPVEVDLGSARAMALGADVTSVSILDLLAAEPRHRPAVLSQAARAFAARLAGTRGARALIYVVPDATDEFALGTLRRSVNAAFRTAEPLPRSVAAVFEWQSSSAFAARRVADGDCVLVLDTVGDTLSATPLLARKNPELARRLPASAGIYWERCPSVCSDLRTTSIAVAAGVLETLGCGFPEEVARLCGLQGLIDEGSRVSWQDGDGAWYTAPRHQEEVVRGALAGLENPWAELRHGLERDLGRLAEGARVFTLLAGDVFRGAGRNASPPGLLCGRKTVDLGPWHEPHRGGLALHRWQEAAGEIALWRDHLPELSMRIIQDGRQARFYLVKDVTVAPRRGQAVSIKVETTFILPAGLPDYRFPLLQGDGGSALRYEAFLRSPSFPLAHDLEVAARLTYSYGSDAPYDLAFRPVENTPELDFVRVEWRPCEDDADLPAHFPTMPAQEPWSHFERYPRRDGRGTRNFFLKLREELDLLGRHVEGLGRERPAAVVSSEWRLTQSGSRVLNARHGEQVVFCRESEFVDRKEADDVRVHDVLRMDLKPSPDRRQLKGLRITRSENAELRVRNDKIQSICNIMASGLGLRFGTLWSQGRSLAQADIPDDLRATVHAATGTLLGLLQPRVADDASPRLRELLRRQSDAALLVLCSLHADAPSEAVARLQGVLAPPRDAFARLQRYHRHLALAIGNCRLDWQRALLARVVVVLREEPVRLDVCGLCLQLLGVAVWRCEGVLATLSKDDLAVIVERSIRVLRDDHSLLERDPPGTFPGGLKDRLELVLGLLRTRGEEDAERRAILAPGRPVTRALARTIEDVLDSVSRHGTPIASRISIDVQKPPELSNTPALLYALKLYLTGDDGARAIRVVGVADDPEEGRLDDD